MDTFNSPLEDQPWLEYQEVMNIRDTWILVLGVIPPCFMPFIPGPVIFILLMKPLSLAAQTLRLANQDSIEPFVHATPDWINSCLDSQNAFGEEITPFSITDPDYNDRVRQLRSFVACGIIYCFFILFSSGLVYAYCIAGCWEDR